MDNNVLWALFFLAGVIVMRTMPASLMKDSRVFVPDYQRAILFVDGAFREILGPGTYGPVGGNNLITVVDMRPVPIIVERLLYQDALQTPSVISIAAELNVTDPYQANARLKNLVNDSVTIIRDGLRGAVSKRITETTQEGRQRAAAEIASTLNEELRDYGMHIANVEITEAWSRSPKPFSAGSAN